MARTEHGTLVADTVTTVTLTNCYNGVNVINRTGTGEIYATIDGVDPVVEADDTWLILGVRYLVPAHTPQGGVTVKLISTAGLDYTVEAAA